MCLQKSRGRNANFRECVLRAHCSYADHVTNCACVQPAAVNAYAPRMCYWNAHVCVDVCMHHCSSRMRTRTIGRGRTMCMRVPRMLARAVVQHGLCCRVKVGAWDGTVWHAEGWHCMVAWCGMHVLCYSMTTLWAVESPRLKCTSAIVHVHRHHLCDCGPWSALLGERDARALNCQHARTVPLE